MVRCSYCERRQHHQDGFLVEFAPGRRHLIGSECGTEKLGLQFASEKNAHADRVSRQSYLLLLDEIAERCGELLSACDQVLLSDGLKEVERAGAEFVRLAGDAVYRLRALGPTLSEQVKVRDLDAESRRTDDGTGPIYRIETARLGQLNGIGILRAEGFRQRIVLFKTRVRDMALLRRTRTEELSTGALRKRFKALDDLNVDANAAITELNGVLAFFEPEHMKLIARWAEQGTTDDIREDDGRMLINGKYFVPPRVSHQKQLPRIR